MTYNLTDNQKRFVKWLFDEVESGRLTEEFYVSRSQEGNRIYGYKGTHPAFSDGTLQALVSQQMLTPDRNWNHFTLTGVAYEAVRANFNEPDTSFVKHLTPLADVTNLDPEIKTRCLPILGAGSADPKMWDSAVRVAGVILEERLRDVGSITDRGVVGADLVNRVFNNKGTLAPKFTVDSERQGYRDLYAGIVGMVRNPSAHHLIDHTPEEGGALIVFVNLLLKKLEALR